MPSESLLNEHNVLYARFEYIYIMYNLAFTHLQEDISDYYTLAMLFRRVKKNPDALTQENLAATAQVLARWHSHLIALEVDNPTTMHIKRLEKRFSIARTTLADYATSAPPELLNEATALGDEWKHTSLRYPSFKELADRVTLFEHRVNALVPVPDTEAKTENKPTYVDEIMRRANVRSTAFQRAPTDRQRTILKPFAKDILQRDKLETDVAAMVSATLYYMKTGA